MLPLFLLAFLFADISQVQAETTLKTENVEITREGRYDAENYEKPKRCFPARQSGSNQEKAGLSLEEYIVAALENYEAVIDVSAYNLPSSQQGQEYLRILNDNPQLFYVQGQVGVGIAGGKIVSYQPVYLVGKTEAAKMRGEFEAAAQQVLEQVDSSMSTVEKALVVHDYLVQNCEYDYERLMAGKLPDISHTAYGALVSRIAVCDGYAQAYAYIMNNKLGISCTVVASDPMNHAWNMIEIDRKWYHTDLTWDDPVWDCMGRVKHDNFLLSDQALSQGSPDAPTGNGNHYAWTQGYTADSVKYDQEFWIDVKSAIVPYNGAWYYAASRMKNGFVYLEKKADLFADAAEDVYGASPWQTLEQFYREGHMYLVKANNKLYFNTSNEIKRVDEEGEVRTFYVANDVMGQLIFGFTLWDGEFLYTPDNPSNGKQKDIRKYALPTVEGITVKDVSGIYNGKPYQISVQGLAEGDVVQYALANGANTKYMDTQPEMINAGTYRVRYRVQRGTDAMFEGTATVIIAKAETTEYTLPKDCAGKSGSTLADIALSEGFAWKTPGTKLYQEGERAYPAIYTPKDTVNYKTVNVEINVKVTCPGHKYTSKVTKLPTMQKEGIRTYTCGHCGNTYTEKIPKKTSGKDDENNIISEQTAINIAKTARVTLNVKTYTYNGKQHKPIISVWGGTKYLTKNKDYTVSYQNNKNVGTASLTVTGIGKYMGKIEKKFTIAPKGTSISGRPKAQKTSITVKWNKQKKAMDGYEIWCSTSKNFTKNTTIKKTAKKTASKLTVKKLKKRTGYYVKVRTYKKVTGKKYYSSWSIARFVRTKG